MTSPKLVGPSPLESLRDALQIAEHHVELRMGTHASYVAIANAIKRGIEGLSEPNEAAIQVTAQLCYSFDLRQHDAENVRREARDTAMAILDAQLKGVSHE